VGVLSDSAFWNNEESWAYGGIRHLRNDPFCRARHPRGQAVGVNRIDQRRAGVPIMRGTLNEDSPATRPRLANGCCSESGSRHCHDLGCFPSAPRVAQPQR
jgi:hypothetical protein